jgi:hypothetical protein
MSAMPESGFFHEIQGAQQKPRASKARKSITKRQLPQSGGRRID